ncbi:MAG: tetratricopeptide repeat protein [Bernardetiaceae bacterium]
MIDFSANNWESDERTDSVQRFEQALASGDPVFLEMDTYEQILDYYHENGDYTKALRLCQVANDIYPYSATVLADKARLLSYLGRTQEAKSCIEDAESLQPYDTDLLLAKAHIYVDAEEYPKAIDAFEQLLLLSGDDHDLIYTQIGMAHQNMEDYPRAIHWYNRALETDPLNEEALLELTYCHEQLDTLADCIATYERVLDADPYWQIAWFQLGQIHHKIGDFAAAAHAFEYATIVDQDNQRAFFWLGHTYMNLSDYTKAHQAYQKAAGDPDQASADMLCHLGASLERLERYEEALVCYYKATKADKGHAAAWYGIGCCLALQERWYEATHYFGKAVQLDSEETDYLIAKGKAEYHIGNLISSTEAYRAAVSKQADNPYAWLDWSLLLYEQKQYEEAADLMQSALDMFPEDTKVMYRLVAFLMLSGRYREAINHLEIALFLDYDAHEELYHFFPDIKSQKAIYKLVRQYKHERNT